MKTKTSELTGAALDWAVAVALKEDPTMDAPYSTEWAFGGPIIERELICINPDSPRNQWMAITNNAEIVEFGPTPLIAACRCLVASRLGDEVEIPEELK
jgi:hypothetical protein